MPVLGRQPTTGRRGNPEGVPTTVSGEPVLLTKSKALERPIRSDEREIVGDRVHRDREVEVAHPSASPLEPGLALAKAPTHFVIPRQADQL